MLLYVQITFAQGTKAVLEGCMADAQMVHFLVRCTALMLLYVLKISMQRTQAVH